MDILFVTEPNECACCKYWFEYLGLNFYDLKYPCQYCMNQAIIQEYKSNEGGIYIFTCNIFTGKLIVYTLSMYIHVFLKSERMYTFLNDTQKTTE